MPKIVEIIGPSGAGKTSIYDNLRSIWREDYRWVTFDDMDRSKSKMIFRYFKKAYNIILDLLPIAKNINQNKNYVDEEWGFINYSDSIYLGNSYKELKTVLMDLIDEHCAKWYDGSDRRFVTIYMMMWSMAFWEKIYLSNNDDRLCILKQGEGFVSRIMHLNSPSFDEITLQKYLTHIPMPDVLIFLDVNVEEVLERIKSRNRSSTLHSGLNDEALFYYTKKTISHFQLAMEILSGKGVSVHRVDASGSISEATDEIVQIIK
jgi:adenylate kinase